MTQSFFIYTNNTYSTYPYTVQRGKTLNSRLPLAVFFHMMIFCDDKGEQTEQVNKKYYTV